ncbi:MAG: antirestriction protein [Nitrospirae bacterium]|nr:antirestriction protein [Nitrospirota bacterium]
MNEKVKVILEEILRRFETGDIPEAIALSMFPIPNIPANKWSLLNRTVVFFSGTHDARGFNQWKETGRFVKKGAKAIHILAPRFKKEEEEQILSGFMAVAVFRVEDTEGVPLSYEQIELELPLMELAKNWGISIRTIPGNYRYYGYYSQSRNEITLASQEECVFFHELSHAAHKQVLGQLKGGQDWRQEIVAELSAAALCHIVGKRPNDTLGHSYRYIERYAKKAKLSAYQGCVKVISDVEKVLHLIFAL